MLHIIDFDCTLFDTKEALRLAYMYSFTSIYPDEENIFTRENWIWAESQPGGYVEPIVKKADKGYSIDDLKNKKRSIYPLYYMNEIRPNFNFLKEVKMLNNEKFKWDKFVICTNSEENVVHKILSFFGIGDMFDGVVGRDTFSMTECKPSISMYERIFEEYHDTGLDPSIFDIDKRISFFDDSDFGLESAETFKKVMEEKYPGFEIFIHKIDMYESIIDPKFIGQTK
jgi:FMN phosphatase YigB (HAD superfamily)